MSEAAPMLAVIMPVYNHAAYIAEAIESVLAQSFGGWALWIIDDGSTDGSGEIAETYAARDGRVHVLHQGNAGPAAARNYGIRSSRSDWLAFIDSDDVYYPTALAHFADFIAANPGADFIYGYRHRLGADGTVTELPGEYQDRPTGAVELFARMYLSHLCVCYRRGLWAKVGGYDERLRSVEDYDLYLRMSVQTQFVPLGKATGLRRRHGANISRQTGRSRSLQAAVLERFVENHGRKGLIPSDLVARRMGGIYWAAGRQYFKQRCFREASEALGKSRRYRKMLKATALGALAKLLKPFGRTDAEQPPKL